MSSIFVIASAVLAIAAATTALIGTVLKFREDAAEKAARNLEDAKRETRQYQVMADVSRYREAAAIVYREQNQGSEIVSPDANLNLKISRERLSQIAKEVSANTAAEIQRQTDIKEAEATAISQAAAKNDEYRKKLVHGMEIVLKAFKEYPWPTSEPEITKLNVPSRVVSTAYEQFGKKTQQSSVPIMTVRFSPNMSWVFQLDVGRTKSPSGIFVGGAADGSLNNGDVLPEIGVYETKIENDGTPSPKSLAAIRIDEGPARMLIVDPANIPDGRTRKIEKTFSGDDQLANLTIELVNGCQTRLVSVK